MRRRSRPTAAALLLPLLTAAALAQSPPRNCTAIGEALCSADAHCAAFGVYGDDIQLHGCIALVANADWRISVRGSGTGNGTAYATLPGTHNIDETACTTHPASGMQHSCAPPPPPPGPPLYAKLGSIAVGTFENTIFFYRGTVYVLENIACSFSDHAGVWQPSVYGNHSYGRVRELLSGVVVANLSNSVGFGFISAFVDYDADVVWLFGTPADRCSGNGAPTSVQAWWSTDLLSWETALAFDFGKATHNVQVTKVGPLGGASPRDRDEWHARRAVSQQLPTALPPHRYAMFLECFTWAINNNADGNLTYGWSILQGTVPPAGAPCGGPSMAYSPLDDYYYILTGGNVVRLYRTQDFSTWAESSPAPFIAPSEGDAAVAPYCDFPALALVDGSPPAAHVGVPEPFPRRPFLPYWAGSNWSSWSQNSNDADICCMHADVPVAYVVWGASTQGRPPQPPLTGTDAGTNAIGVAATMPLPALLAAYFANSTQAAPGRA